MNTTKVGIPFTEWSLEDHDLAQLNAKYLNYLFYALKYKDYIKVFTQLLEKKSEIDLYYI